MTQETVKALSDGELVQVIAWAQNEQKARAERKKRETIAKIKEMAQVVGVSVRIAGGRGRPPKTRASEQGLRKNK
jgi:hypothetical protein